jgi:hypothetical protein
MDARTEVGQRLASQSVRARTRVFGEARLDLALELGHSTITPMMLAPCSVSSMLSASLRPGQWPGLRALTTPARGTDWQSRDGGRSDEYHNDVDDHVDRAYGGLSPQCRTALLRFAATASGARIQPRLPGHGLSAPFTTTSQFGIRASGGAAFSGPRAAKTQRPPVA